MTGVDNRVAQNAHTIEQPNVIQEQMNQAEGSFGAINLNLVCDGVLDASVNGNQGASAACQIVNSCMLRQFLMANQLLQAFP